MTDTVGSKGGLDTPQDPDDAFLVVRGAYKRYGPGAPYILKNLCMSVQHNSIYALLGASGCGKTTLLSAIVSKFPLDAGAIRLCITSRRQLGFMPQQMALYSEFSIAEMFQYFGILYSMSQREIDQQVKSLTSVLSLPDKNSLCGRLSGGQQRRVSVAVTMMHSPRLLILDEPTAGLDHTISATIWQHLRTLAEGGVTCIITTHYIEEARHAHKVGMMRHGVILEEDSPHNLLMRYETESLEEVFLVLSEQQEVASRCQDNNNEEAHSEGGDEKITSSVQSKGKKTTAKPLYPDDVHSISKDHIRCQMFKYFNWMKRNVLIALFIILLPGFSVEIFNMAFKNPPPLSIAVLNLDSNCTSPATMGCADNQTDLSCHFLEVLREPRWAWHMVLHNNYQVAMEELEQNKYQAVLRIPKNFTGGIVGKINMGRWVDTNLLASSFILADLNRADWMRSQQVENGLLLGFQMFYKDFIRACDLNERLGLLPPINFAQPVYGEKEPIFVQYISSGLIIQISFAFPILFSVSSLISEKLLGLMERSLVAGLTVIEVLLAHSLMSVTLVVVQSTVSLVCQYGIWNHPFYGNYLLAFALLVSEGICGTVLGFVVALCANSYTPGALLVGAINSLITIFCGYMWPIQGMHPWAQPFAYLLPPTTGIKALRAIVWKNFSFTQPEVLVGFLPPFLWTLLFIINMAVYARRNHML